MTKKVSPGEIGRKVEIPPGGQPLGVHGSVGIVDQPILMSGQTAAGSYLPLKVIKDGSVGQLDIHGIIGTVYVGTVAIGAIAGSVHIQGTINTINYVGSIGHVESGSVGLLGGSVGIKNGSIGLKGGSIGVKSGSIGILGGSIGIKNGSIGISGQPIAIHGSIGVKEGGGRGTVEVSSLPSITGTVDIRTGSVGISHLPPITGSIDVRTGSIVVKSLPSISGTVAIKGQPIAVTGSINIGGGTIDVTGSVGIKEMPSISGTVDIRTGSIGISHLPPVTGSVDIRTGSIIVKSLPSISGTVEVSNQRGTIEVSSLPPITGSIDIRTGSIVVKSLPAIHGSVGIKEMAGVTGSVDIRTGSIIVKSLPSITGSIDIRGGTVDVDITSVTGKMSTNNSTTTPLGIDAVFTGTAEDIKDYAAINISIFADQNSATDGLSVEWSQDGTNWDEKMTVGIGANKVESYEFGVRARYFRLVYTNGGTAQGVFRLQVIYHPVRTRRGARCLCVDIDSREFAPTRRAILAAKKPNEDYTNINATTAGNLKMAIEEYDCSLPAGSSTIGSVGIVGQPIAIHGSIGVKEGGGRGTVEVSSLPSITGTIDIRTGSVGISHLPPVTGSIDIRTGSIVIKSLPAIHGSVGIKGTVQTTATLAGSIGIKNGSIGINKLPAIHGSVGIKEMAGVTGSVDIRTGSIVVKSLPAIHGSVGIKEMAGVTGSVGIKELPYTISIGSPSVTYQRVHMTQGSIGIVNFPANQQVHGTVGISGQPISIHGSVGVKEGGGRGTVEVSSLPSITGSVYIKGQPISVKGTVDTTMAGSIGIKNGSIGINKLPSITGTVDIRTGSVGISHLPPITGSVDIRTGSVKVSNIATDYFKGTSRGSVGISAGSVGIKSLPAIHGSVDIRTGSIVIKAGSVGIKSLPSISGTVDIRTGSLGISGQPIGIHGSIGIKEGGGGGSVAIKNQDMPFFGSVSASLGTAATWSDTGSISGYKNIVGYAYFTHFGSVYVKQSSGSPFDVVSSFGGTAGETIGLSVEVVAPRVEISIKNSSGTANTVRGAFYKRVI